ncbi:MAG TPA: D-glycerate dehydrogenase, partial [Negativicutes bacterium]|nr:D-glycerate dehydrogenase [Negativicutes bacterium]
MKKPNVYVTRMLPQPAIDLLKEHCEVEINPDDRVLGRAELLEKVRGRDAVLCLLTDTIDDEVFAAAGPQCKIFANYAVGFNNVDVAAATRHKIMVSNTPDVLTDATADLAWTLLFATARRVVESDTFLRDGKFKGWGPMLLLGLDITGKTLGVIGSGRIGGNFAAKAKGFKMKILYNDIQPNPSFEAETGGVLVDKETLLKEADFVSIHVPLMPSTHHLISTREFKLMKNTAVLINTSRGPVVDEKALVQALKSGEIWGAGLDVFENEPAVEPELLKCKNAVLLPHVASGTIDTRTNMGLIAVRNILAAMKGEVPPTVVNKEVLG